MNADKLITDLTETLDKNSKVKTLILAGSFARQTVYKAEKYSDMEAYIVVDDENVAAMEAELPEIARKLGNVIFSYKNQWAGFSTVFEEDLFRLELPVCKFSEISTIFNRPKAQELKVLFDKTDGELQKLLDQRPETIDFEKYLQPKIVDFWYMAILGIQYYKKGETWNSIAVLRMLQTGVIKLWELENDSHILLLESNKRIEKFLTSTQLKKLKDMSCDYANEEVGEAFKNALENFSESLSSLEKKYGYIFDHEIEAKIKPQLLAMV